MAQLGGAGEALAGPAHVLAGDLQAFRPSVGHQRLQVLGRQGQPLGRRGVLWHRPAAQGRVDAAHQPGGSQGGSPHHDPIGAGDGQAAQGFFGGGHVAVGDHGNAQGLLHSGDGGPVGAAGKALLPCAAVQGERLGTGVLQTEGESHRIGAAAAPAQPRLHRDRHAHRSRHRRHDLRRQRGLAQQAAAAAFARHLAHRAAHVDVDQEGARRLRPPGGLGQGLGTVVEQLHRDRPALAGQSLELLTAVPPLQAGGVHHLRIEEGVGSPTAHEAPKDLVAHPRQGRLEHPAAELARLAAALKLKWKRWQGHQKFIFPLPSAALTRRTTASLTRPTTASLTC